MQAASCPACGGALAPWISVHAGEPSDPRDFPLRRCAACGSAVTGGDAAGRRGLRERRVRAGSAAGGGAVRALQRATVGQPVRLLRRAGLRPGARVLDAGAGRGRLVEALRRAGYDARGIDPSGAGPRASSARGRSTSTRTRGSTPWCCGTCWSTWTTRRRRSSACAGWLAPGGLLLVGVPNAASLQARVGGPGWLHWDAPRHRVHLTPAGLEALLVRARASSRRGTAHMVWEHNPAGMWMALLTRLGMTPGFPFHLLKRNARARPRDVALLALGVPLAPVALALEAGAAAAHRGGTIAALARATS